MSMTQLTIALTGGIGSGKSTVSNIFAHLGVKIIDTDIIARDLVKPGQDAYKKILAHFGEAILQADKTLNRQKLRKIIFQNSDERLWLEAVLHPLIRHCAEQEAQNAIAPYLILVIPLLNQNNRYPFIDRVLLVDVSQETQINRVRARDQNDETIIKAILASQLDREARLALADDVILNEGDIEALQVKVEALHQEYMLLANKKQHNSLS